MPEEEDIHQPHDKLFTIGFGEPANAAGLLKAQLPATLAAQIDWSSLNRESGSFVDPEFRKTQTDLLFSAALADKTCLLYVLFEHQTQEEPFMALRLLRYILNIWWECMRRNPSKPLPIVLPVVLAQNAKVWKVKPQFSHLLDIPEGLADTLKPYLPDFCFELFQLAEHSFEELPGTPAGILILRVMKAERLARLLDDFVWDENLIGQTPDELFLSLLRYILAADIDSEAFNRKIQQLTNPKTRSSSMSLAQQFRQEGRQEGLQEGHLKGTVSMTLRQVRRKFPSIAAEVEPLLSHLDEERLLCFGEAILFFQTPEECLAWLRGE